VGGNLTTTDLIGNAVRPAAAPRGAGQAQGRSRIINGLVEEVLRYEPPVDITGRIVRRPWRSAAVR
jgi:cytochrome P450